MLLPFLLAASLVIPPHWTPATSTLLIVWTTEIAIDRGTTEYGLRHGYAESNFILGKHPSVGRLNTYTIIVYLASLTIATRLDPTARSVFLASLDLLEGYTVYHQLFKIKLPLRI